MSPSETDRPSTKNGCKVIMHIRMVISGGESNKHSAFYTTLRTQPQPAILLGLLFDVAALSFCTLKLYALEKNKNLW